MSDGRPVFYDGPPEERTMLGSDEAKAKLVGQAITSVEFVEGEAEDDDYVVIRVGDVTIYGSTPSVYDTTKEET